MTKDDLKKGRGYYRTSLCGSSKEKVTALDRLQACRSWDVKRWVQGSLFSNSLTVRERAARFIAETDYLPFLSDLEAACRIERDEQARQSMMRYSEHLEALSPHK